MTCDRYRPRLALLIGNDLDAREAAEVRQHLGDCAACQAQWASLQESIGALQLVSQQTVIPDRGSLRTQLLRRIKPRAVVVEQPAPSWPTLGAFMVACAAVMWLTVSTPVFDFDFRDPQMSDSDPDQLAAARPVFDQSPQIQLVTDAQPIIPMQMVSPTADDHMGHPQFSPRILGGPRSF